MTSVIDTDGKFANVVLDLLPTVSVIPLLHLELPIFSRIFEKNLNGPKVVIRGLGEIKKSD